MIDYLKKIGIPLYLMNPKPFGLGYNQYKIHLIKKILDNRPINLKHYMDERIVEIPWIMSELKDIKNKKILDAGCTLNFNYLIKKIIKNNNKLIFVNLFKEKNFFNSSLVNYQIQDISNLKFDNDYFDVVTCLSVIEHVGFDNSMYNYGKNKYKGKIDRTLYKKAILELKRVLKPNKWLYLTFPFGKKMTFNNYKQFDANDLEKILEIFNPKEYKVNFYKFKKLQWLKTNMEECKSLEPIYKEDIGISSKSIALIQMKK